MGAVITGIIGIILVIGACILSDSAKRHELLTGETGWRTYLFFFCVLGTVACIFLYTLLQSAPIH